MAVLGLRFCARAFSSCGKRGPLFIAVRGPLTVVASLVAEHRLQTRTLSSCGLRAQPPRGMWDLPGPGPEPVSPALAGGLLTTAPPGKPIQVFLLFTHVYLSDIIFKAHITKVFKNLCIHIVSGYRQSNTVSRLISFSVQDLSRRTEQVDPEI